MPIDYKDLSFYNFEKLLIIEYIYLGSSTIPSSVTGANIPEGLLCLTNRRLFFFYFKVGSKIWKARPYIFKAIFDYLSGQAVDQLLPIAGSKLLSAIIDKTIEKIFERKIDTLDCINNTNSFVISLENIIKCEIYGDSLPFQAFKEYVKIDVFLNNINKSLIIYSVNPLDHKREINYGEWARLINDFIQINRVICEICKKPKPLIDNICYSCGSPFIKNSHRFYNKGLALINRGRYDEAIECFNESLKIEYSKDAIIKKAECLYITYRYGDALACFEEILHRHPLELNILYEKARLLEEIKDYDKALEIYESILQKDPRHFKSWYRKALIFFNEGQYDKSTSHLSAITQQDSESTSEQDLKSTYLNAIILLGLIEKKKRLQRSD